MHSRANLLKPTKQTLNVFKLQQKMTKEQLNRKGFIVVGKEIIETTYRNYLNDYGADETTSPNGVAPRLHIREKKGNLYSKGDPSTLIGHFDYENMTDEEQDDYYIFGESTIEWQLWSWGIAGNHPYFTGSSFDNEEEAELEVYEHYENYIQEHNWNAPVWNDDKEKAIEDFANWVNRPIEVVKRYFNILEITTRKNKQLMEETRAANQLYKFQVEADVRTESDEISIDQIFVEDLKTIKNLTGSEKSSRCAVIMKALLLRSGKAKIYSDFWKIFRILKAKAEKQ